LLRSHTVINIYVLELSGKNIGSNVSTYTVHVSRTVTRRDGTEAGLD